MFRAEQQRSSGVTRRMLVEVGTALYVVAVYALVVLGGATATRSAPPSVPLAVLATAIVALTLEPIRLTLRRRLMVSADDTLAQFATALSAAVATGEVAPRMARLIAEATGAQRVEVWLTPTEAPPDLAARWPADSSPIDQAAPTVHAHDVRRDGETLGRILRDEGPGGPLNLLELRLIDDLVSQAGIALRTVALSAELERRIEQSTARAAQVTASRQRIVATADIARRRLERDVHDGAQQNLVALAVNLSLAATVSGRDGARAATLVGEVRASTKQALSTLEDLSRGIYPRLLTESGLGPALRAAVSRSPIPVSMLDETDRRFPGDVEAAVYFGCLEAVQNALKHADARHLWLHLHNGNQQLSFTVRDDGIGFDREAETAGSGLANIRDRVESLGGTVAVLSVPGLGTSRAAAASGTAVIAQIPVGVPRV